MKQFDFEAIFNYYSDDPYIFTPSVLEDFKNGDIELSDNYNISLNPQLHSRSATYIKRNGLLIRKITIKSSRPFQCAYHPLTP